MEINYSQKFQGEFHRNKYIESIVDTLPQNYALSEDERLFLLSYSGMGQQFEKEIKSEEGLYEFYTPDYLRDLMWELAYFHGYNGGSVLEPSCATGHMFLNAPKNAKLVGVEMNPITAKIAQICFPKANIVNLQFEQLFLETTRYSKLYTDKSKRISWLEEYPFDLVIGNPPYGQFSGTYKSFFPKGIPQIEIFFLWYCLRLLKPGGVLVFLTQSSWLRNGNLYNSNKVLINQIADLKAAFRLPKVFKRSGVPADIYVYTKK